MRNIATKKREAAPQKLSIFKIFTEQDFPIHCYTFTRHQEQAIDEIAKALVSAQAIKAHSQEEVAVAIGCCLLDSKYFAEFQHHFVDKITAIYQTVASQGDALIEQWLEEADDLCQQSMTARLSSKKQQEKPT